MPETVTIATFNAENLFRRFRFRGRRVKGPPGEGYTYVPYTPEELTAVVEKGLVVDRRMFDFYLEDSRRLTAAAIKAVKADIVGLQEIESLDTLKLFNSRYLSNAFRRQYLIDGNDPRFIDVAILSNLEVDFLRTHQFRMKGRSRVFSRDCLEAHVRVGGKRLPVFVNHFKSMVGGRAQTKKRRLDQCEALLGILTERFGQNFGDSDFVVLGDLNDYMEPGEEAQSGLRSLLESDQMENIVNRLPEEERWTHFYNGDKSYHQLDYILLSRSLAARNAGAMPVIERRGQPLRVNQPGQPVRVKKFFPEVKGKLKASDHCPVAVTLEI